MTISSNHYIYNLCQLVNLCQTREDWSNISFPEIRNKECVKFGRDFRADADPLLPPLQCSMGWRLELVNVIDSMAGHITITKWVVEVTMDKRLYCLVLHYLGVVSHQHQLFGSFSPGPGHRVSGGAADDGGQELPLPPGTLIRLKGNKQWTFHSFSSGYKKLSRVTCIF